MKYFNDIESFFERNKLRKPAGCNSREIDALEMKVGFPLPGAYREYLELMGKDYQGVMKGTDCFIDDAISNTDYLPELLKENELDYELPPAYLAFYCHQGYIMAWFTLPSDSENPTCYFYSEGTTDSPIKYGKFKQFITKDILGNAKIEMELRIGKKWWHVWK